MGKQTFKYTTKTDGGDLMIAAECKHTYGTDGICTKCGAKKPYFDEENEAISKVYEESALNEKNIENRGILSAFDASKAYDLASKYLAVQSDANELYGLGVDSSALRLSSQYQRALSDANAEKEQSLMENYINTSERVDSIRGEWDSRRLQDADREREEKEDAEEKEAAEQKKAEDKYNSIKNDILLSSDEASVKRYLEAMGYEEDSNDYNSLMGSWYFMYGRSEEGDPGCDHTYVDGKCTKCGAKEPGYVCQHTFDADGKCTKCGFQGPKVDNGNVFTDYNIDTEKTAFDPKETTDTTLLKGILKGKVNEGDEQTKYIKAILQNSKNWGPEYNGIYVDFNYGFTSSSMSPGTIFVFYDGLWYPTKYSRQEASGMDNFYSEGNGRWIRGNDFTDKFSWYTEAGDGSGGGGDVDNGNVYTDYNIDEEGSYFNAKDMTAESLLKGALKGKVYEGEDQTKYLETILQKSKDWGADYNGTYVDFNYGATSDSMGKGTIFVFYNGNWYPTTLSRKKAFDDDDIYKHFYSEGFWIRGNDFSDKFGS